MTSLLVKTIGKRVFKESAANHFGQEDPYFETIPATRLGVRTTKKRRKALPPGLTDQEAKILTKVKRRAYRLDLGLFNLCGISFGWGSVVGIVPGIGDVLDLSMAYMVYKTCDQVTPPLPSFVKHRMEMNMAIDFLVGLVPFLGDIADALYKCNTRNAVLLEEELRKRGEKRLKANNQQPPYDPSLPENYDNEEESTMVAQNGPPPRYTSNREPGRPENAQNPRTTQTGGAGWFGGRNDPDLESGPVAPSQPPRR